LPRLLRHPAGLDRSVPDLLPMMLLLVFDVAKVRAGMLNIEVVGHGFSPDKQQFPLAGWRRGYGRQQVLVGKMLPVESTFRKVTIRQLACMVLLDLYWRLPRR